MNRREFLASVGAGVVAAASRPTADSGATQSPQTARPYTLDAIGEIRLTHPMELIREVLASGTNSVMVTLTDPKVTGEGTLDAALRDLVAYDRHIRANATYLLKATTVADIERARREGKLAIIYNLQDTTPIHQELSRVDMLFSLGVRCVQLTYNYQNSVGSGCRERGANGLTVFGNDLIARMNEVGMLVDTSHANMKTMADAIAASKKPIINSHTACQALQEHVRNTTDQNMRAMAERGGLTGICQMRPFLTPKKSDNLDAYFAHIDHAVQVAGIDHVCIGSDRDHRVIPDTQEEREILYKEEGPQFASEDWPLFIDALNTPRRMEVIWDGLRRRHPEGDVEKIMGRNLLRLYGEIYG
jgi:membrane dipeptidase